MGEERWEMGIGEGRGKRGGGGECGELKVVRILVLYTGEDWGSYHNEWASRVPSSFGKISVCFCRRQSLLAGIGPPGAPRI
jgi:hypothetical protein